MAGGGLGVISCFGRVKAVKKLGRCNQVWNDAVEQAYGRNAGIDNVAAFNNAFVKTMLDELLQDDCYNKEENPGFFKKVQAIREGRFDPLKELLNHKFFLEEMKKTTETVFDDGGESYIGEIMPSAAAGINMDTGSGEYRGPFAPPAGINL